MRQAWPSDWGRKAIAGTALALAFSITGGAPSAPSRTGVLVSDALGGGQVKSHATVSSELTVVMGAQESFAAALARAGFGRDDAQRAAAAAADEFDVVNPHPGVAITTVASAGSHALERASFQARPETRLSVWRDPSGRFRLRRDETAVYRSFSLVQGPVNGSLYLSIVGAGLDVAQAARVTAGFGARLDLARDVESGDRFRCVLERREMAGGRPVGRPDLIYAELITKVGTTSLYGDGGSGFEGREASDRPLLRTPVDATRISSPFGMRLHPILGYSRMHQGVDFAAAIGAPVLAAGDGVVEEARWAGGYGRWLKIRHASGLETGYAHLSAWASGIEPGARVRQGQVVGYVGATGLATGPHLHYEVIEAGRRIDPGSVGDLRWAAQASDPAVRARKASIDAMVASLNVG